MCGCKRGRPKPELPEAERARRTFEQVPLALGLRGPLHGLGALDLLWAQSGQQAARLMPGLLGGVARDHVQPDREAKLAVELGPALADPRELLGHPSRRLAPGQIHVGLSSGNLHRLGRGAAEVDLGPVGCGNDLGRLDAQMAALEINRLASPELANDVQEFARALIALGLIQEVAKASLLGVVATGNHVEQQPSARDALVGRGHLGGQGRGGEAGTEGDQKAKPFGDLGQGSGHEPALLAPGPISSIELV